MSQAELILNIKDMIECEAYADMFRLPGTEIVCKLFKNGSHVSNVRQGLNLPDDDVQRKRTFLSECAAYKIASAHPLLKNHIPTYYGEKLVSDVIQDRKSLGEFYLLNSCYQLEFIEGRAVKLGHYRDDLPEYISDALKAFSEVGVSYLDDASVFFFDDAQKFKFIDFAIEDYQFNR